MTVAFDASGFHSGTWGYGSALSQDTHTHTPAGTPRAAIVYIVSQENSDLISTVKWGGASGTVMTELGSSPFIHTSGAGEHGTIYAYFLGSGIPTGAKAINVTSTGAVLFAIASITLTAAGDTVVNTAATNQSDVGTAISVSIPIPAGAANYSWTTTGTDAWGVFATAISEASDPNGVTSFVSGAIWSGRNTIGGIAADAGLTTITEQAFSGAETAGFAYGTSLVVGTAPTTSYAGGQERGLRIGVIDGIGWEVDGLPVRMIGDWQAEVQTGWGDRAFTGAIGREVRWAEQGAPVTGWKRSGEPLWQGTLVVDPRREGDVLRIRAEGNAAGIDAIPNRLFYRVDGAAEWEDRGSDPYGYNQNEKFDLFSRRGSLVWKFGSVDTFNTNDAAGFAFWREGGEISRYTCTLEVNQALGGFDFLTRSFTGPDGTQSDITTQTLNFGGPLTLAVDATINAANREDGMTFVCIRTGAASTPNGRRRLQVRAIKVYGRTLDENFTVADVVSDVAELAGLGTDGIDAHAMLVLPLDWTEDPTGLLDYMAELTDWRWMVRGTEMTFGPYGKIWESATGYGAVPNLEPQPRANVFRQPFRTLSGALRHVDASPEVDPFPGQEVVVEGTELENPQPNADLATAVAAAAVEYEASVRRSGPVELTEVRYIGGTWSPYDVDAGDQLLLTDLAPDLGPQRIEAMTYRPGGRATAQLGDGFNLVAELAAFQRPPRKRAKGKKRAGVGGPIR